MGKKRKKMEKKKKKKQKKHEIHLVLPLHILHQLIFPKLSIVDLQACRQVCKTWKNIILQFDSNLFYAQISHDPISIHCMDFDPKHMGVTNTLASFTFNPKYSSANTKILCSCNGLLLCSLRFFKSFEVIEYLRIKIFILNPVTNEYLHVCSYPYNEYKKYYYGFGFGVKTKQFKIVRFSDGYGYSNSSNYLMEIFEFETLGSGHRRPRLRRHPLGFLPTFIATKGAYYFNGALYWVGTGFVQEPHYQNVEVIYRLDLEDYKLDEFCVPQHSQFNYAYSFGAVNGADLYVITLGSEYQVWKMEQNPLFVVPELNLRFSIHQIQHPRSSNLQLIKVCEDGKLLYLLDGVDFLLCDPNTGMTTQVLTHQNGEVKKYFEVFPIQSFNFNSLRHILLGLASTNN